MANKRDKRVEEIDALRSKLPQTDFKIEISDNQNSVSVSSYSDANGIIGTLLPEHYKVGGIALNQVYLFASYATDKQIKKKLKISILSIIHQNYKLK